MSNVFAVDVGGTFTDLVFLDAASGEIRLTKAPTTPATPAEGIFDAIRRSGLRLGEARLFFHGTTLGVNTLLERKGASVGLITTRGFRDILEFGHLNWPMYQLHWERPKSLVPRYLRREVRERVRSDGVVLDPIDEEGVRDAVRQLTQDGAEAIAVCFLHSYVYPEHEELVGTIIEAEFPDIDYSLSHLIAREYREYERMSTTIANAAIHRRFVSYVEGLEHRLAGDGFEGDLLITRSDGGVMSSASAKEQSIRTLMSGPASGVMGAVALGGEIGLENLIAIDMGGTSFDAAVVLDGQPSVASSQELEGLRLLMPVIEMGTIGAGGGSVAWIDEGGALDVGPHSAGAEPGPMCYGRGGSDPTFTDAALVTDLLNADYFLGGEISLDVEAAQRGIREVIAEPLGMDVEEAASGIVALIEAKMAATLEELTVGKGYDPRDFTLFAYGGGGPLVASALAKHLEIPRVLIPTSPATFSAMGMLKLDLVHDLSRTLPSNLEELVDASVAAVFSALERQAGEQLAQQGVKGESQRVIRAMDMRYENQEHTLTVLLTGDMDGRLNCNDLRALFDQQHEATYGYATQDVVQVTTYRVRAIGLLPKPRPARLIKSELAADARKGNRLVSHRESGGKLSWDVFERNGLGRGAVVEGPAVVEEPTATTLVVPGQVLSVDDFGHLILEWK